MTDLATHPALMSLPPFSSLPEDERKLLLARLPRRIYPAGASIMHAGKPSCGLSVLLSGNAKLVIEDPEGRQLILAFLRPGELFGEIEPFERSAYTVSAVATNPCEVLHLPAGELVACMAAHPRAALQILAEITGHLRSAYAKIANFAFDDVRARVAHALLEYGSNDGTTWTVGVGSEELARIVGASREMVSRVLRNMQTFGLIRRNGRRISVVDREHLLESCARRPRYADRRERATRSAVTASGSTSGRNRDLSS